MSNHPNAADVALAGHNDDLSLVIQGFGAPEAHVRATALGSFHRLKELDWPRLKAGLTDDDVVVRRRATELSHRIATRDSPADSWSEGDLEAMHHVLIELVSDESSVAEVAAFALGELDPTLFDSTVSALALDPIARHHDDPLVRESAVAALGSLHAGLDAILNAMNDKATVRRRAVIALSPFDDPRADEALRMALDDRDWQVRQAAEDLVAIAEDGETSISDENETS